MEKNEQAMLEILAEAEIYVDEICAGIRVDLDVGFKHGPITYKEFGEYHERMKSAGRKLRVLLSRVAAPEPAQPDEVKRLQAVIEKDRSDIAGVVTALRVAIRKREWLRLGRGSYEYNDERWKDEFGAAMDEISSAVMEPLKKIAADWSDSPEKLEDIQAARRSKPAQQTDRNAVLEEAAKIVEATYAEVIKKWGVNDITGQYEPAFQQTAVNIRALKSTPPQQPEDK